MSEFTGSYNKCEQCTYIYDNDDICPECGSDIVDEISPNDIRLFINEMNNEKVRLEKMLKSHGDLKV